MEPEATLETHVPTSWRNPSIQIIRRPREIGGLESSRVSHISYLTFPHPYLISNISYSHITSHIGGRG